MPELHSRRSRWDLRDSTRDEALECRVVQEKKLEDKPISRKIWAHIHSHLALESNLHNALKVVKDRGRWYSSLDTGQSELFF
jgi:hypothetical protein